MELPPRGLRRPVQIRLTDGVLIRRERTFIGGAIQELQEQGIISYEGASVLDWLLSLGVNPTWEAIVAQLAVASIAVGGTLAMYYRRPVSMIAAE